MIHSPTAFMKGTEIWLRYNERPEPVRQMGLAYTPSGLLNEPIQVFRDRVKQWQSSLRECVWQDQKAIRKELNEIVEWWDINKKVSPPEFEKALSVGIPLNSIARQIELRQRCIDQIATGAGFQCGFAREGEECDRCQPVAVLLPAEETVAEESQEHLLKALLLALADKQDALSKFIITRRK